MILILRAKPKFHLDLIYSAHCKLYFRLETARLMEEGFSLEGGGGAVEDGEDAEADDGDVEDSEEETDKNSGTFRNLPIYVYED